MSAINANVTKTTQRVTVEAKARGKVKTKAKVKVKAKAKVKDVTKVVAKQETDPVHPRACSWWVPGRRCL